MGANDFRRVSCCARFGRIGLIVLAIILPAGEASAQGSFGNAGMVTALVYQTGDPTKFKDAYERSEGLVSTKTKKITEALKDAESPEKKAQLEAELKTHLKHSERILKLALKLAGPKTSVKKVNRVRYRLAYVLYLQKRHYEAAVLAGFVARHFKKGDSDLARDSAYLAIAASHQAYLSAGRTDHSAELRMLERATAVIVEGWPGDDKTGEACLITGSIYRRQDNPSRAAYWLSKVPASSDRHAEAQLSAGQSYWAAYRKATMASGSDKPSAKDLQKLQGQAEKYLKAGIAAMQKRKTTQEAPDDSYIAAKVALAGIYTARGEYPPAVELLVAEPYSVLIAIKVADKTQRPDRGIKSRKFAALSLQLLLRAYVGSHKVDDALATMDRLERVWADDDLDSVTRTYRQLGRELQQQIERLREQNDHAKLADVGESFGKFLDELYRRKDRLKYGSLLWMAETYYGLAEGMSPREPLSVAYYKKAAEIFENILQRADIPEGSKLGIKVRLLSCKRRFGDFEGAVRLVTEVLKKNPKAVNFQFEAARIYQDWGTSEQSPSPEKLLLAINGNTSTDENGVIWGWGTTAQRLRRSLDSSRLNPSQRDQFTERYLDARFQISWCRRQYALLLSSSPELRKRVLEAARKEVESFAMFRSDVDRQWKNKFNALYQDTLSDLNLPAADLKWKSPVVAAAVDNSDKKNKTAKTKKTALPSSEKPKRQETPMFLILLALAASAVVAGLVIFLLSRNFKPKQSIHYANTLPDILPELPNADTPAVASGRRAKRRTAVGNKQPGSAGRRSHQEPTQQDRDVKKRVPRQRKTQ